MGDWTGTGRTGIGAFDPSTATFYLRNAANAGAPDAGAFRFGGSGWAPVVGDWNGSGHTGVGVFDPTTATFYLRNEANGGAPDAGQFVFGGAGWQPLAGDWDGTGHDGIGAFDPTTATWFLRNEDSAGAPDAGQFPYGAPGWLPVAGDWNHTGHAGVGVIDPGTEVWYLRNGVGPGAPDAGVFQYGGAGWKPVVGDWNGDGRAGIGVVDANGVAGDPTPFTAPLTLTASPNAADPTCPILHLMLGPIHLNLLGLKVDTSKICLDITAQHGPGNLLGNLLCDVANLLNGGTPLGNILGGLSATDLTTLENGLTGLLNGALGSLDPLAAAGASGAAAPAVTVPATNILHLSLGPVNLNLLGLVVNLNNCAGGPVTVDITAQPGPGNLLGNLLNGLAHLLDNNAGLGPINGLLRVIAQDIATLV